MVLSVREILNLLHDAHQMSSAQLAVPVTNELKCGRRDL